MKRKFIFMLSASLSAILLLGSMVGINYSKGKVDSNVHAGISTAYNVHFNHSSATFSDDNKTISLTTALGNPIVLKSSNSAWDVKHNNKLCKFLKGFVLSNENEVRGLGLIDLQDENDSQQYILRYGYNDANGNKIMIGQEIFNGYKEFANNTPTWFEIEFLQDTVIENINLGYSCSSTQLPESLKTPADIQGVFSGADWAKKFDINYFEDASIANGAATYVGDFTVATGDYFKVHRQFGDIWSNESNFRKDEFSAFTQGFLKTKSNDDNQNIEVVHGGNYQVIYCPLRPELSTIEYISSPDKIDIVQSYTSSAHKLKIKITNNDEFELKNFVNIRFQGTNNDGELRLKKIKVGSNSANAKKVYNNGQLIGYDVPITVPSKNYVYVFAELHTNIERNFKIKTLFLSECSQTIDFKLNSYNLEATGTPSANGDALIYAVKNATFRSVIHLGKGLYDLTTNFLTISKEITIIGQGKDTVIKSFSNNIGIEAKSAKVTIKDVTVVTDYQYIVNNNAEGFFKTTGSGKFVLTNVISEVIKDEKEYTSTTPHQVVLDNGEVVSMIGIYSTGYVDNGNYIVKGTKTFGSDFYNTTLKLNHDLFVRTACIPGKFLTLITLSSYGKEGTIDLNNHNIKYCYNNKIDESIYNGLTDEEKKVTLSAMFNASQTDGTLNIIGNGILDASHGNIPSYVMDILSDNIIANIKGGTFIGGTSAIQVEKGTLNISGGKFDISKSFKDSLVADAEATFLINAIDDNFKLGTAKIYISGGEFVNFNPAASNGEPGTPSLLVNGYETSKVTNEAGENIYTVRMASAQA